MTTKHVSRQKNIWIALGVMSYILTTSCCIYNKYVQESLDRENIDFIKNNTQKKLAETKKDGKTPAVLLIHGFGGSAFDFKPLAKKLKENGYAFKAIVLPGHGTNPRDLQNVQMEEWLEKAFVEYHRSNHIILYDYDSEDVIKNIISFLTNNPQSKLRKLNG